MDPLCSRDSYSAPALPFQSSECGAWPGMAVEFSRKTINRLGPAEIRSKGLALAVVWVKSGICRAGRQPENSGRSCCCYSHEGDFFLREKLSFCSLALQLII